MTTRARIIPTVLIVSLLFIGVPIGFANDGASTAPADPLEMLKTIQSKMSTVGDQLQNHHVGTKTQELQQEVADDLATLIAISEQLQQQREQKQKQQRTRQNQPKRTSPSGPASPTESGPDGTPATAEPTGSPVEKQGKSISLRDRDFDPVSHLLENNVPEEFRVLLERYFRIASENDGT